VPASVLTRRPADLEVHTAHWPANEAAPADAPLQVAVHGLGASYLNWLQLAPLLRCHGDVWAPDLVGFGLTPLGGRSAGIDDNLDLLRGFVQTVSPDRPVVLLGNSMGGLLSLTLAGRHPELVAGLILINPALPRAGMRLPDRLVTTQFLLYLLPFVGTEYLRRRQRRMTPREQVEFSLELCGVEPENLGEAYLAKATELARKRRAMTHAHPALLQAARSIVTRTMVRPRVCWRDVDNVKAPTLLVHGGRDRLVPIAAARAIAERRPDWEHRLYDELGHIPLIEDPQRVSRDIAAWRARRVDRHSSPASPARGRAR
jgi:pimeloyl-ACP methyl ester carboxylesterase